MIATTHPQANTPAGTRQRASARRYLWTLPAMLVAGALLESATLQAAPADRSQERGHEVLDNRFQHGRYYPPRGAFSRTLPHGYRPYYYRGNPYYFSEGVWYAPGARGFYVVRPPIGLNVSLPPPYYTTVWSGSVPYYYADDTYYRWMPDLNSYSVVAPPPHIEQADAAQSGSATDLKPGVFVYPKNGQSNEQQAADRFDCHSWARKETGFDPTQAGGGVPADQNSSKSSQYDRATSACLEARGYSIK